MAATGDINGAPLDAEQNAHESSSIVATPDDISGRPVDAEQNAHDDINGRPVDVELNAHDGISGGSVDAEQNAHDDNNGRPVGVELNAHDGISGHAADTKQNANDSSSIAAFIAALDDLDDWFDAPNGDSHKHSFGAEDHTYASNFLLDEDPFPLDLSGYEEGTEKASADYHGYGRSSDMASNRPDELQLCGIAHGVPHRFRSGGSRLERARVPREEYEDLANKNLNDSRNFGRQANTPRANPPGQPPSRTNTSSPSAFNPAALAPQNIPPSPSPSLSATMSTNDQAHHSNQTPRNPPFFFREEYTGFMVRGNFMTLAAKPVLVELGEWLGHQVVEQNRLLDSMVKIVGTDDRTTGRTICNDQSCPSMSAGSTNYTWIDTNRNPINIPAMTYIKHIQTWIAGKIQNEALFPVAVHERAPPLPSPAQLAADPDSWLGKTSGFPRGFETEIKNMYKQMFRCYAHLYWSHWLDFWHLSVYKHLNTCFIHFITVGRLFGLLTDADMEPMAPLIDIWLRAGHLPQLNATVSSPPAAASPSIATPADTASSGATPAASPATAGSTSTTRAAGASGQAP